MSPNLRKLLPQSLFARLVGALIAVIGVTLLIIVVLIVRERSELAFLGSGAWNSIAVIADASEKLAQLPAHERQTEIEKLRTQPQRFEQSPRRRRPQNLQEMDRIEHVFAVRLRKLLGPGYQVVITRPRRGARDVIRLTDVERFERRTATDQPESSPMPGPPAPGMDGAGAPRFMPRNPAGPGGPRIFPAGRLFDVSVRLPDGHRLVFRTPAPQPAPPLPRRIFFDLGLLTTILVLVLYFMTRSITRPLSDLARAADAVGRGEDHPPLKERGARELRDATHAFNAMQDRLRRYLDSRTRVLAAMSHDLRTPLTRLRLRAEAIEDDAMRERFVSDLEEMTQMVNGALNLFKGLTDSETYAPVVVDDLLTAMQAEYAEMGASIGIEGRSNGPIQAKPAALKRCLSNLLHNAIKYGERATVRVTDGAELTIRIRDEGEGLPAEVLEQVFEPFYRLEASRSRDTGGTGLGLSIARDIAQAHGGSVVLANIPGGGLEATLTLPRGAARDSSS